MGVPAFYRWLADKYPKTVVDVVEVQPDPDGGGVDATQPNPNGVEFDNLYLDMNGIIHPCVHPEGREAPKTEEDMFLLIFEYIDRIFNVVRPRKLLFMAIDGPAPRAKMNQQRTRRFKAAKERSERDAEAKALAAELLAAGKPVPSEDAEPGFDSNVITPGTPFMGRLAKWLQYYVQLRQATNPAWAGVKVILSDASVPGEGEHKLMEHIRRQRGLPGYDANSSHVIHGLDADLIMLALATHEPHFCILREVVADKRNKKDAKKDDEPSGPTPLQFLKVWTLREYLHKEFTAADWSKVPGGYDLERVIDDFVFMCFFVGNDFLPHLPAVEIRDGAIDMLVYAYKQLLPQMGGYLSDAGRVHLARAELLLREVSAYEQEIFDRKRKREEGFKKSDAARAVANAGGPEHAGAALLSANGAFGSLYPPRDQQQKALLAAVKAFAEAPDAARAAAGGGEITLPAEMSGFHRASAHLYIQMYGLVAVNHPDKTITLRRGSKKTPKGMSDAADATATGDGGSGGGGGGEFDDDLDFKTRLKLRLEKKEASQAVQTDEVRYGEGGWKQRYYTTKLHIGADDKAMRRYVVGCYVQGLCWVLMYYYQGVQDWEWFYPFHYAPCASDLVDLMEYAGGTFDIGRPFSPFEQLMAVLPPESGHALPTAYRALMVHPASPIIDFYPTDFADDLNGKKHAWQAIALLPFIDAARLRATVAPLRATLTDEEKSRDAASGNLLFVSGSNPVAPLLRAPNAAPLPTPLVLDPSSVASRGYGGSAQNSPVLRVAGTDLPAPPGGAPLGLATVTACASFGVVYEPPAFVPHVPSLLAGVTLPPLTLDESDQPQFSRDAEMAVRNMASKYAGHGAPPPGAHNGRGGGGGRGGGRDTPATRVVNAALGVKRPGH